MPDLPSGTVTFLFTDIEGSTQLWEQHPQAMELALAQHHTLLRQAIEAHGGQVFQIIGDAFCAAFPTAPAALRAALAAQRTLRDAAWEPTGPIRVRMALHTATVAVQAGDYPSGPHFNRLARLLNAGHGGQTLLSAATHELLREHLPVDTALHDLGAHQLKDLSRPEQIFQLLALDLGADFPPLRTLDRRRTNLPAQPTALIGREHELADVAALLRRADVRLVTLTGSGGTGKTRLGLQVAAELLDNFAQGVYFVNLAPLSDPELVAIALAKTLGVKETNGRPLIEDLQAALRERQQLLLLDNFEQVADAAPLVAELLAGCPCLKILVTSRVPLHLRGEKEIPVPPLALPNLQRLPTLDQLTQYAAVELFIQRAVDVQPAFAVTNDNAPAVAEICARLDGLPLAVELAAARIKLFAPEALLARLSNRLALLTRGARDLPARQQTLRNAIDWSYDLLDPGIQMLFARLAVFVGGCTPDAAEAVCNTDGYLSLDVLDGLALLVDNSLLRRAEGVDDEPRFVMLETIREYALERLVASGEAEAIRRQHATYYLALAETAEPQLIGLREVEWHDRLEREHDNLRGVLQWTLRGGSRPEGTLPDTPEQAEIGLRLAGAVAWFWRRRGYMSEGRRWLEALLGRYSAAPAAVRAKALRGVGRLALDLDDYDRGIIWFEESRALCEQLGDKVGLAWSIDNLAYAARGQGDFAQAVTLLQESLVLFQEIGDKRGVATSLFNLSMAEEGQGNQARAKALAKESMPLFREVDDRGGLAWALFQLGRIAMDQHDYAPAMVLHGESAALFRELHDHWGLAWALHHMGLVAQKQGDYLHAVSMDEESLVLFRDLNHIRGIADVLIELARIAHIQGDDARAKGLYREILALRSELGGRWHISVCLMGLAGAASAQGRFMRAARLFGAAEALDEDIDALPSAIWRARYDIAVAAARAELDEATFAAAWAAGRALTLDQAIAEALGETAG
jgi:predicted ATPase/class 3 adenylate cyclase